MRRSALPAVLLLACAATAAPALAEVTRILRVEVPSPTTGRWAIENLAGSMRVRRGQGPAAVAVATVHAESQELADAMRFEQVTGEQGTPTWRVRYPLDRESSLRYPGSQTISGILAPLIGALSGSTLRYDGRRVRIGPNDGVLLYADVEVQLPAGAAGTGAVEATFRNLVGSLHGEGVEGRLLFDSSSGDVTLDEVGGHVKADTGSGNVTATDLEGSFTCDTGSGNCSLDGFRGEAIDCDVGSGNVRLRAPKAHRIKAGTGSGNVRVLEADTEEFDAETGSGDVELEARGARLARVSADTGSGNVLLRLPADASFEAFADQGSGDLTSRFTDAQPILKKKELVGYRRGDGRIKIRVDTGSGDLTIEPLGREAANR